MLLHVFYTYITNRWFIMTDEEDLIECPYCKGKGKVSKKEKPEILGIGRGGVGRGLGPCGQGAGKRPDEDVVDDAYNTWRNGRGRRFGNR